MATATPFAYNIGSTIPGTEQVGSLAVGTPTSGFTNNPQFWNGPDEELGYVIAVPVPDNTQPTPIPGVFASVGFYRSEFLTEGSFVELTNTVFGQNFANGTDCKTWLNDNGYWTSFVPPLVTPTPTNTQTPSVTPTLTPTPSTSPIPVTGYGYNLVVLPYNSPTSGNTIFPTFATPGLNIGTTNPNTFDVNGIYWNIIDNSSVDRTSYYSGMTGVSVTAYFTQNSNTVIYSGSPTAFIFETGGDAGFNYNPNTRPGQLVLIQSASTNFVTGQTVYISYVVNGAGVTPTPTGTPAETPTPTPTPTNTITPTPSVTNTQTPSVTPTLTQTPTSTDLSTITTYTISGCSSSNVIVADLGPGAFFPGDTFYLDFTGATATECYTIINKINATPTDGGNPISSYPNCADCIDGTTTTYTISGCTTLNVLVADLGPGAFGAGDIFNMTFTGATPSGCYRIVNKIVATPTDTGAPLTFYFNCDDCEASLVTPTPTATPTNTSTPTPSVTNTQTSSVTPTPTNTPTETEVLTPTPTETETPTPTPTGTPVDETPTPTPTETETPTPTPTPTGTPLEETPTPTPTPTGTPEAETPTPTPTGTPLEETPTPTPTPTGT
jgi:hypothetical protein